MIDAGKWLVMGHQYKDTGGLVEQANMFEQLEAVVDGVGRIDLNKDRFCVAEIASQVSQSIAGVKMPHLRSDELFYIVDQRLAVYKIKRFGGLYIGIASCDKHIT